MIVCLCRRVSDRDIAQAVRSGTSSFEVLQDRTGVASHCGCCHDCAREAFQDAQAALAASQVSLQQAAAAACPATR